MLQTTKGKMSQCLVKMHHHLRMIFMVASGDYVSGGGILYEWDGLVRNISESG